MTIKSHLASFARFFFGVILVIGVWYLTRQSAQYDFSNIQERIEIAISPSQQGLTVGQTFKAAKDHLIGVQFHAEMAGNISPESLLQVHLRSGPTSNINIASTSYSQTDLTQSPWVNFTFPPQDDSRGKTYFIVFETNTLPGAINLSASQEETYQEGSLYLNNQPATGDLAFRVLYRSNLADLFAVIVQNSSRIQVLFGLTVLFWVLGYALLILLDEQNRSTLLENTILALLAGLAFVPILIFALGAVRILVSQTVLVWIIILLVMGAGARLLLSIIRKRPSEATINETSPKRRIEKDNQLAEIGLIILFIMALFIRLFQVQDIYAPLWVDGFVHQGILANIVQDRSISPDQFYHIGFHAAVSFVHWLTGHSLPELSLLFGQWLSAVTGLSVYLFAKKVLQNPMAALASACVIWFLAPMPAYFITWSRYPFLLGLTLLPAALAVTLELFESKRFSTLSLTVIFVCAIVLAHYGTFVFWITFLPTYMVCYILISKKRTPAIPHPSKHEPIKWLWLIALILLPATILLILRIIPLFKYGLLQQIINQGKVMGAANDNLYLFNLTLQHGGLWVWIVGISGGFLALLKRRETFFLVAGWFGVHTLFTLFQTALLGSATANYANLILATSLPLSILVGYLVLWLGESNHKLIRYFMLAGILLIALMGGYNTLNMVNPQTILFSAADMKAMAWIKENTPENASFLIDVFYWSNVEYRPSDGGGWIPAFTNRQAIAPGQNSEVNGIPGFIKKNHIQYIYLGNRPGQIDRRQIALAFEQYRSVYQNSGIIIYQIAPP
jgi:hypothetical protein